MRRHISATKDIHQARRSLPRTNHRDAYRNTSGSRLPRAYTCYLHKAKIVPPWVPLEQFHRDTFVMSWSF